MFKANCRDLLNIIQIFILKFLGKVEVCKLLASPLFPMSHIPDLLILCLSSF